MNHKAMEPVVFVIAHKEENKKEIIVRGNSKSIKRNSYEKISYKKLHINDPRLWVTMYKFPKIISASISLIINILAITRTTGNNSKSTSDVEKFS